MTDTKITRTPPPPLEYRAPACSMCDNETSFVDGHLHCSSCDAWWTEESVGQEAGEWGEDQEQEPQCRWVIQPYANDAKYVNLHGHTYRCVKADGHHGDDAEHIGLRTDDTRFADIRKWHDQLKYERAAKAWQLDDETEEV